MFFSAFFFLISGSVFVTPCLTFFFTDLNLSGFLLQQFFFRMAPLDLVFVVPSCILRWFYFLFSKLNRPPLAIPLLFFFYVVSDVGLPQLMST